MIVGTPRGVAATTGAGSSTRRPDVERAEGAVGHRDMSIAPLVPPPGSAALDAKHGNAVLRPERRTTALGVGASGRDDSARPATAIARRGCPGVRPVVALVIGGFVVVCRSSCSPAAAAVSSPDGR